MMGLKKYFFVFCLMSFLLSPILSDIFTHQAVASDDDFDDLLSDEYIPCDELLSSVEGYSADNELTRHSFRDTLSKLKFFLAQISKDNKVDEEEIQKILENVKLLERVHLDVVEINNSLSIRSESIVDSLEKCLSSPSSSPPSSSASSSPSSQ